MSGLYTQRQSVSLSANGNSASIPVDPTQNPFQVTVAVVLTSTPSLTYEVDYTTDNTNWVALPSFSGQTASDARLIYGPVLAVRLNVTNYVSGTATLNVIQAGNTLFVGD
jgi:hypothetical protein